MVARKLRNIQSRGDHNFSHLYDRVSVDLAPLDITVDGIRMTTSPVMFKPEDTAWWKFSGDMMRLIEVLEGIGVIQHFNVGNSAI